MNGFFHFDIMCVNLNYLLIAKKLKNLIRQIQVHGLNDVKPVVILSRKLHYLVVHVPVYLMQNGNNSSAL